MLRAHALVVIARGGTLCMPSLTHSLFTPWFTPGWLLSPTTTSVSLPDTLAMQYMITIHTGAEHYNYSTIR